MQLDPILTEIDAAIQAQLQLADPTVAESAALFLTAFTPAVRQGLLTAVEQAAAEVSAQLGDRRVDVRLVDGEPELAVGNVDAARAPTDEELEARLTLRLPTNLKQIIEDAAAGSGESINGWVVDALRSRTTRVGHTRHVRETFDL
ncbi:MAG TPA: YlcI/YnfO family protein [Ilumatobacter sp.]|nr:YlcI/YnfO family protein [Ilumatobacter sp.]